MFETSKLECSVFPYTKGLIAEVDKSQISQFVRMVQVQRRTIVGFLFWVQSRLMMYCVMWHPQYYLAKTDEDVLSFN
jgi:hypothetical protein